MPDSHVQKIRQGLHHVSGRICTTWRRVNSHSSEMTTGTLLLTSLVLVDDWRGEFVPFNWVIDRCCLGNKTFSDKRVVLLLSSSLEVAHCAWPLMDQQDLWYQGQGGHCFHQWMGFPSLQSHCWEPSPDWRMPTCALCLLMMFVIWLLLWFLHPGFHLDRGGGGKLPPPKKSLASPPKKPDFMY